jgi:MYXO-CTERM domain-containing protein
MRTGTRSSTWWALVALLLLAPGARARADVVESPPEDCPPSSVGDTCHGGPFCKLITCTMNTDCTDGATCQDVMACVGSISCGGLEGGGDPPIPTTTGPCKEGGTCDGEALCKPIKQCVAPVDPTTGGTPTTGGSATGTATTGTPTTGVGSSGGSASSSGGDTGGTKGGCASCAIDGGAGAPYLALLAIAALVRGRRRR